MSRVRRRVLLPVTAAVVVVAAVVGLLAAQAHRAGPSGADDCAEFSRVAADRLAHDTGSGRRVVVVGDSYSVGYGLTHPGRSWPSRLPGLVHVAGFSGSGFAAHDSACGRVSYADRAGGALLYDASAPSVVVVEGGLNDWRQPAHAVRAGFRALMHELRGLPVVVAGPTSAPARIEETARVDRLLRRLAHHFPRVTYVSMLRPDLPYLGDRLHLTEAGHDAFGDRVARRVRAVLRDRPSR